MKKILDKILGGVLVILMAINVMAVLWQVFSRYILQNPSSGTEEIARFLLIWIGLLGAAYASGQQEHLSINILPPKLEPENRIKLMIFINILIVAFCVTVLVIGGGNLVLMNIELGQNSAALHLPISVVYMVIPLSGILIIIYKLNEIFNAKKYLL
ncbi:TRAP transporter small permease [Salegentibacter salegens]|jgi:TRAP-type C4-dicarboxylate transport system permease small subunit|uniref:TRAP-type C4-dicarboxylate transport system, small permease component n=1 Tax=Salegentibacter salegens TaxID=143223 RepID=A0A1M7IK65_9FLAO|nr:TRAP transporter small permease [Salegentibacter salegens]PRX42502.1 TRAP-type C4-dicarboxylate transport system permease small subunit [Salegentibacter salegens]SHM40998.1 TRAP-type C4-dicarboxylate transport system, small permease component [Salegentibacter salegens]